MGLTKGRQRLDYGTLKVSIGPPEILKQWLDTGVLRGQVGSPKGAVCTWHPQDLTPVHVGGKYFNPDSGPFTLSFTLLIKNSPVDDV